ncbi:MAG: hypothetical protein ACXWO1_13000, partial [Isosphaeraceae bacterium]
MNGSTGDPDDFPLRQRQSPPGRDAIQYMSGVRHTGRERPRLDNVEIAGNPVASGNSLVRMGRTALRRPRLCLVALHRFLKDPDNKQVQR